MLRHAPALTAASFLVPIAAGLAWTLLPAFGFFPAIGGHGVSLDPWRELFAYPGIGTSLRLTLTIGLLATILSLALAAGFCALAHDRPSFRRAERFLAPLLATPHAAVAIGIAFLAAPSGWLVRLISPWLTGWDRPPTDLVTVQDPLGLACVLSLLVKEVPYLVLMIIGATTQVPLRPAVAAARAMGYRRIEAWLKVAWPLIYPQIRLPVFAVLAYSLSVVEVGMVLAPGNPPPLAILAAQWFSDYDVRLYFPAAAAASLQFAIVLACIALWRLLERAARWAGRPWIERGARGGPAGPAVAAAGWAAIGVGAMGLMSIAGMAVWSFAAAWRFPDMLPSRWTLATWMAQAGHVMEPATATIVIAASAAVVALALALACLENEQRCALHPGAQALWILYLPLLVPQIAFLFGIQVVLVRLDLDGTWLAVAWMHLVFVLPYVFLSLADPWRALDRRYVRTATGLGAGAARIFWRVKLPMLLRPVLIALAVGFAVSIGQYLPTVFAGAGRVATLTTEAVTLSGGSDRRIIGVYALLLAALPLLIYGAALAVPALVYRHRRALA